MSERLTEHDARVALRDHVLEKAEAARRRYGDLRGRGDLLRLLSDSDVLRYPVQLRFDASELEPGEFGYVRPNAEDPRQGFVLFVHPSLEHDFDACVRAVLYHLVVVNYGEIATGAEAEAFGASILGVDVEQYYCDLCELSDRLGGSPAADPPSSCGCPSGTCDRR
ncbi:MAG: hypothetical protein KDC38_03375 [Planctomycetes bacterium]|nr:hypothetical protein [Planctomycetota bacterium]